MKRIIFMGTPAYGATILEKLAKSEFELIAVFTQPDRPVGRKAELKPSSVKEKVHKLHLTCPIFQPDTLKTADTFNTIKSLNPDFIVVAAYGQILPENILRICPCINLHASILPQFRGASPIQEAVLAGLEQGGVTAMRMGVGLDDGDILAFSVCDTKDKFACELFETFAEMAGELALKVLREFDSISPCPQPHVLATKCGKVKKERGLFSVEENSGLVMAKFRALTPWPGLFFADKTKLLDIALSTKNGRAGEILDITKDGFVLALKSGSILVKSLQEPGKKPLAARDYINGKRLKVGDLWQTDSEN